MNKLNRIEMVDVCKSFGGVYVLKNITFSVKKESIMGLVGENGAGKSTLMKILTGIYSKDSGKILIDGKEVNLTDYSYSKAMGIALLPQELDFIPNFTVAENMFLGNEPTFIKSSFINWKSLYAKADKILKECNISLNPRIMVKKLSISQQQMMVVAKILSQKAKVIIFDEPTTRLGQSEKGQILSYITYLKSIGISIIYISHQLEEIFSICDEITVLRDGKMVGKDKASNFTKDSLIKLMVARSIVANGFDKERINDNKRDEILKVENLTNKKVKNINFILKRGEILGIAGLVGAGRTEMVRALLGIDPKEKGTVFLDGKEIKIKNFRNMVKEGFALVPEERRQQGIILNLSIKNNLTIGNLKQYSFLSFLNQKKETREAKKIIKLFKVNTNNVNLKAGKLSGGNQQRVVLAKWLSKNNIKILVLDEPTRGIDVGAKAEIYELIKEISERGISIIMVSSEIPEIQEVCHRVLVMKDGTIKAELDYQDLHAERLIAHAIGIEETNITEK